MVKIISKRTTPLCFLPSGRLVCYKDGQLLLFEGTKIVAQYFVFNNFKERVLGRSTLFFRLLRLGIRASISIDEAHVLLSIGNSVYEYDFNNQSLSSGVCLNEKVRPLVFTNVSRIDGFDDGIYFGEYLQNKDKKSVNIHRRVGVDQWEKIYTFPQGAINHVHNIVVDPYRNCLWIFTGDFDEASAIWKVTDNFRKVERVVCNDQKYRGCVVYALPDGLLYATDAPFQDDYIYLMNTETYEVKEVFSIHGSCIYGCQWQDKYVFSTTVEGDGRNTSKMEFLFGRKRGAGIKDNYVHMYIGNLMDGFKEVYKEPKDWLPFYTFQFGVFKFPVGTNSGDSLYFQPVATKKNDLRLLAIKCF